MKPKFKDFFMDVACRAASLSYAERLKVGAILVKDDNIIAFGYNGTPPGEDNCCEDVKSWYEDGQLKTETFTKLNVRHAEENLQYKMSRSPVSSVGSVAFISHLPCPDCALRLRDMGIAEVHYKFLYRNDAALTVFEKAGIPVVKHEES